MVWILISWFLQAPADLDLPGFPEDLPGFSRATDKNSFLIG